MKLMLIAFGIDLKI